MEWPHIYQRLTADRNDPLAWSALEHRIACWARAVLRGEHAIDDAVADTCAAVLLNLEAARGEATFGGFVYGHFLNVRRGLLRATRLLTLGLDELDLRAPEPDEGLDASTLVQLHTALATLPPRKRQAITLRYFDEQSSTEIGQRLGVTRVNARRIVYNGLRDLRAAFRQPAARLSL